MKQILAVLLCGMLTVPAQSAQDWWVPSPVSLVLTVGQWLMRDQEQVFFVTVQATAVNETDAREEAFRAAIAQAVGSFVMSERTARDGDLIRDEIINYSSGFVHDFEIKNRQVSRSGTTLTVDVWVKRSQIADRLLNKSRRQAEIEGGRISAQIQTWRQSREASDKVLEAVLNDYPSRAFDISIGSTRVSADPQRRVILEIPVAVSWNASYLNSLEEAVNRINQRPDCNEWFSKCQVRSLIEVRDSKAWFDDEKAFWLFSEHAINSRPSLLLSINDKQGQQRYQSCFSIPEMDHSEWTRWTFVSVGAMQVKINHRYAKHVTLQLDLDSLPVADLDKVEVQAVRSKVCPSGRF